MKTIRIDFCDFWPGFRKDDNRIYNLLKTRYAVELHDREHDDVDRIMAAKAHFCSFIASNTRHPKTTRKRNAFFHRLSRYKNVDAGGRAFNNIGYRVPGGPWGKIEFLKPHKFNIAFENASLPGYTTEKIVEPMAARCLPIYWGNPLVHREFNPKSFLNYFDFRDEDAADPYFHQNRPNEFFGLDRVLDHFEMIFSASTRPVAQRRRLFTFGRWTLARRDPT